MPTTLPDRPASDAAFLVTILVPHSDQESVDLTVQRLC